MNTTIQYTLLRILLFLASLLLFWLVGLKDPLILLLVAATVSMLLSLFLLSGLRERMSADLANRVERRRRRSESGRLVDDTVAEDQQVYGQRDMRVPPVQDDPDGFR